METKDYLNYVVHEIHRTIVATVDDEGLPVTAAIDMMDCDAAMITAFIFLLRRVKVFMTGWLKDSFWLSRR